MDAAGRVAAGVAVAPAPSDDDGVRPSPTRHAIAGARAMIVYEVSLAVDPAIAADYRAWLGAHVEAMLALPGFVDARCFDVLEPAPADARVGFCVQYRLRDAAALEAYLATHAVAMRDDGRRRFGDRFSATRRVLREA